jgi:hypothetical protein
MKALAIAVVLFANFASAAQVGPCSQVEAEKSAVLALTNTMKGDVFGSELKLNPSNASTFIFEIGFLRYHQDEGQVGLIPCNITVPVNKVTCNAEIQVDNNLVCFQ